MSASFEIRPIRPADRWALAELIYVSINHWYQTHGMPPIFRGGPAVTDVFYQVYQALDPDCALVAEHRETGRLMASCFYHPRPRHVSLGIMNAHPAYFGSGAAKAILGEIIDFAGHESLPLRLTQSALNLDSYSLYTRAGFVPRCAYQDMILSVPESGVDAHLSRTGEVRPATAEDVSAISELESELSGITREQDYEYCIENQLGCWHTAVVPGVRGLDGFLISCTHPAMNMIGPGFARDQETALALIHHHLNLHRGRSPVVLVPVEMAEMVRQMYRWGARNCELHFCQVLGDYRPYRGVNLPSFLPETG